MEASAVKNKSPLQPKPMSELLPNLGGLFSKDAMMTLTASKKPRKTEVQTRTTEKVYKPLPLSEMRTEIRALRPQSPARRNNDMSTKKKGWNSSIKVDKKISHTSEGQLKNHTVRKVLNFRAPPIPGPTAKTRMTALDVETPKFHKPEMRAKKSLYHVQGKNSVRISGICNIPPTPVESKEAPPRAKVTANKENYSQQLNTKQKTKQPLYKTVLESALNKKKLTPNSDTLNSSWKSGSDASFLQKEKEIHEIEEQVKIITEQTLENIAEVSPPASTPFKEYRSVQEFFNNSSCLENSALYNDNTILCFDKPSISKESAVKEESVIVSLCEMFNKATVAPTEKLPTGLDELLDVEKETENHLKMLESGIQLLTNIKEHQIKFLQHIQKLKAEKNRKSSESDKDKTLVAETKTTNIQVQVQSPSPIISRPCSVIKSCRSPVYKIPKKNMCLQKKVTHKSMPNVSNSMTTPVKDFEGEALNMYMKMKKRMNFLSTPMINREMSVPDTPALTSHNVQRQINKLFES